MTVRAPRSRDAVRRDGALPLPFGAPPRRSTASIHLPPPPSSLPSGFSPTVVATSAPSTFKLFDPRSATAAHPRALRPPARVGRAPRQLRSMVVRSSPFDEPSSKECETICASLCAWRPAASSPTPASSSAPAGILRASSAVGAPTRQGPRKTVRFSLPAQTSDVPRGPTTSARTARTARLLRVFRHR
jgi:hypothetical protein